MSDAFYNPPHFSPEHGSMLYLFVRREERARSAHAHLTSKQNGSEIGELASYRGEQPVLWYIKLTEGICSLPRKMQDNAV
jgi:hypothetical protein